MRLSRRRILGWLALVGALALGGSLTACGKEKESHTSRPVLYEVRRGTKATDPLVAAVLNMGGEPQYGQMIYSPSMMPIQGSDTWNEVGEGPPAGGWCPTYAGDLSPGAMTADWEGDTSNRSNEQPCPE